MSKQGEGQVDKRPVMSSIDDAHERGFASVFRLPCTGTHGVLNGGVFHKS